MSYRNGLNQQKALTISLIKFNNTFSYYVTNVSDKFCKHLFLLFAMPGSATFFLNMCFFFEYVLIYLFGWTIPFSFFTILSGISHIILQKRDRKGESHVQCMNLNIYIQIILNLIHSNWLTQLDSLKLHLIVMANEISLTLKQIASNTIKFLENSYAVFNWKVNSTVWNL